MKYQKCLTTAGRATVLCAFVGAVMALARPALAADFFVDPIAGDDSRSALLAQSPATAWKTLAHALSLVQGGHRVVALPGVYAESVQTSFPGVVLQASAPGAARIQPAVGASAVQVNHPSVVVADFIFEGGAHGLRASAANGLIVRNCVTVGATSDGFMILDSSGVTIEGSRAISAGGAGIVLKRASGAYLRSNLIYDNTGWGVDLDNSNPSDPQPAVSVGNVLAFNTVALNGGSQGGGVRFLNATGEVRDNVLASNAPVGLKLGVDGVSVHHDLAFGNPTPIDPVDYALGTGIVTLDPLFVLPAGPNGVVGGIGTWQDDDFSLAQTAAGQAQQSPAVDAGSGPIATRDIAGSTRTDEVTDAGVADLGFHQGAGASTGVPPPQTFGAEYFVDCASGDDARTKLVAQSPATPWLTIRRAVASLTPGDVLTVAPGTCNETASIEMNDPDVTVQAAQPGATTVTVPAGQTGFQVKRDGIVLDGLAIQSDFQGVLAAHSDAGTIVHGIVLRDLTVRPSGASISQNAVQVRDADALTVENCVVTGSAGGRGILLKKVTRAYVRNNLVFGNPGGAGIDFDNSNQDGSLPPLSTGNVAASNTVSGNQQGIRFNNSAGEIRDNVVVGSTGIGIRLTSNGAATFIHHNDSFGNGTNYSLPSGFSPDPSNLALDPLFVSPGTGNFALSQTAAGQASDSPVVDRGSAQVGSEADIDGSTRSDAVADVGIVDMGYHAGASGSPSAPGGPGPMPPPMPTTYYVNCTTGNDAASKIQAQLPWTPWQTINHALAAVAAGDTIVVQAGTCTESLEVTKANLTIRADTAGAATIAPPTDVPAVQIKGDGDVLAGFVIQSSEEGVHVAKDSNNAAISDVVLRDLRVQMTPTGSKNGIFLQNAVRPVVENSVILDATESGIRLNTRGNGVDAYIHNNLITGSDDWGIFLTPGLTGAPVSTGNVVAFNTVVQNGVGPGEGGIFLDKSRGEIRDNIVSGNSGRGIKTNNSAVTIHHNNVFGQPPPNNFDTPGNVLWANLQVDPAFVNQAAADYHLRQVAAGQASNSPMIDAGSGSISAVDISGSTRTDAVADSAIADLGFHQGAGASTGVPPPAPLPSPTPSGPPPPGSGPSLYIDPAAGNDGGSRTDAMSPSSPWKTLQRALNQANAGDVVHLLPGVYAEQADVNDSALTLVGDGPLGSVVIAPPAGKAGINVPTGFTDVRIQNLVVQGGAQGIRAENANGIRVTGVAVVAPATVGIQIVNTTVAWVDSSIITGAGTDGVLLRGTSSAYVRNNLIYTNGEWGISVDNDGDPAPPPSTNNVISFNTVHRNQDGIRMLNASGEVRDNLLTEQTDLGLYMAGPNLYVHHNDFSANGRDHDRETAFASSIFFCTPFGKNPRYVEPDGSDGILGGLGWADDRFQLSQLAAGDPFASPVVNVGSGFFGTRDISGSTRSDGVPDSLTADLGFHYGASPAAGPPPIMTQTSSCVFNYYVNASTGDDATTDASARNAATPWRTIGHALQRVEAGATIVVAPGEYLETAQIQTDGVALVAEPVGKAAIRSLPGGNAVTVEASSVTLDGFVLRGQTGVSALAGSDELAIRNCIALGSSSDGFRVVDSTGVTIEDSRAIGSAFSGILLRRVDDATVRNNLLYDNGEWGLSLDNSPMGSQVLAVSAGNLVAENTIAFNTLGNLRLANAVGEIRDNLLTDTVGVGLRSDTDGSLLLNNGFARDRVLLDPDDAIICLGCAGNRYVEPRYIAPEGADGTRGGARFADDDFRLAQFAAGQTQQSDAVDAGSDDATALGATGTTATNGSPDTAAIDMGFHYGATDRAMESPRAPFPEASLHVDASTGDDARSRAEASSAATPWKTIVRALAGATPGDTILIAPGLYPEPLRIDVSGVTLRGTGTRTGTRLAPGDRVDAVEVRATDVTLENLWIDGARRGVYGTSSIDGLVLKDVAISSTRREGVSIRHADGVTLDGVIATGSRTAGIRASLVTDLELRDCVAYANRRSGAAFVGGNANVAFGTFYGNGMEGIRASRTALTLRDSIVAANVKYGARVRGTTPVDIRFVHFFGNPAALAPASIPTGAGVSFALNPLLVDPDGADGVLGGAGWLDDDLSLSQIAGGQAVNSPAVDAGSGLASDLGVNGSTASNAAPDVGQADLGAHR